MKFENLKEEIKSIAEISDSVPEKYRDKCFELLLSYLLSGSPDQNKNLAYSEAKDSGKSETTKHQIPTPSHIKAFMRRKGVSQQQLENIIMIDGDDFHFIKEPEHGQAAKGQIEWALLVALKNGILNNSIKADPEDIRSMVQDKGFYDQANFASNFKKATYASYFKGALVRQGDAQELSNDGETALAELIKKLAGS